MRLLKTYITLSWLLFIVNTGAFSNSAFSRRAIQWSDSVTSTLNLEQKVAQVIAARVYCSNQVNQFMEAEIPPGFLIGRPVDLASFAGNRGSAVEPMLVPDTRGGFNIGDTYLPFPDEQTLSIVPEGLRSAMKKELWSWLKNNKLETFIGGKGSAAWILKPGPAKEAISPALRVWYRAAISNGQIDSTLPWLNIHHIPALLTTLLPPRLPQPVLIIKGQTTDTITNGYAHQGSPVPATSVEMLLNEGLLFLSANPSNDIIRLATAFRNNWLCPLLLEKMCRYVLAFKFDAKTRGGFVPEPDATFNIDDELNLRGVYESSVALFQHEDLNLFPLKCLDLEIGYHSAAYHGERFIKMASNYLPATIEPGDTLNKDIVFWLADPLVHFHPCFEGEANILAHRYPGARLVLIWGGDTRLLPFTSLPAQISALFAIPSNIPFSWDVLAQAAFNGIAASQGTLDYAFPEPLARTKLVTEPTRFKFGLPEEVGVDGARLNGIRRLVEDAIKEKAFPGAQVLVARHGVVIYNQTFGHHSYDKNRPVKPDDIYDLASISKIAATMPVFMKLHDSGKWRPSDLVSTFIPEIAETPRKALTMQQLLLHESGFPASISFHFEAINQNILEGALFSRRRSSTHPTRVDTRLYINRTAIFRDDLFSNSADKQFSVPVARGLYLDNDHLDTMFARILSSNILSTTYRYSDLNFILLQVAAGRITGKELDEMSYNWFYRSLGATTLVFNPWEKFNLERVVPTERDEIFRGQLIHGHVHDPSAAMMGGVAGHAGLFGSALDLAKVMQMLMNRGEYGGKRFLSDATVSKFTSQQHPENRRGLGFDKPDPRRNNGNLVSTKASANSFGHSGFTGTLAWADPDQGLVYVFLSNRIYPRVYNRKLFELSTRARVHDIIYNAIIN